MTNSKFKTPLNTTSADDDKFFNKLTDHLKDIKKPNTELDPLYFLEAGEAYELIRTNFIKLTEDNYQDIKEHILWSEYENDTDAGFIIKTFNEPDFLLIQKLMEDAGFIEQPNIRTKKIDDDYELTYNFCFLEPEYLNTKEK